MVTGYILLVAYGLHFNGITNIPETMFLSQRFESLKACQSAGEWIVENQGKVIIAGNNGKAKFTCLPDK